MKLREKLPGIIFFFAFLTFSPGIKSQNMDKSDLDQRVEKFLKEHSGKWHDMNIPSVDGKTLYDIIIKNGYKSALEIGTSTGHSGIWIAWALSKTGGKLITIDIDEGRFRTALENFEKAGLSEYIDARLSDAHRLVKELKGPFDFVFCDADKDWYKQYFLDVDPKLKPGGCYTAHNISEHSDWNRVKSGQDIFLQYIRSLKNYETTVNSSGGGISISYKNRRQENGDRRTENVKGSMRKVSGFQLPVSGLQSPASGLRSPVSGLRSPVLIKMKG